MQDGKIIKIKANKKIIVCAGINSPLFLLHSGVGDAEELKKIGVPVIYNNPNVGKNLENQTLLILTATANPQDMGMNNFNDLYVGGAFLPDPSLSNNNRDIQLIGMNMQNGIFNIIIIPLKTKSRGSVKIISSDPLQVPLIDLGYFNNKEDITTYKAAIKQVNDIVNNMGDPTYKLISPDEETLNNDVTLEDFIKENLEQNHHWIGSCRMSDSEKTGVVDHNGDVFGVKNLMVVDASILSFQNDGNTSAPTYLIANIIADKLLKKK